VVVKRPRPEEERFGMRINDGHCPDPASESSPLLWLCANNVDISFSVVIIVEKAAYPGKFAI